MRQFAESVIQRLATLFDPQTLGVAAANLFANVITGLVTFFVYYMLWKGLDRVAKAIASRMDVDETNRNFTLTILKFVVLSLALVNALAAVGVNTASLLTSLGIAGLTIGFAARDALSNMISGILIYWDRPFVIGDLVEVGEHYGRVDRITLRSTRVVTVDGRMLAVPNTEIINKTVASYTNFPNLRIDIPVTVGVGENLSRAREVLLSLVEGDPDYMDRPPAQVLVTALNDYNVQLELQAWAYNERGHIKLRADLRERVFEGLRAAGVDMPFETLKLEPLTVRQVPAA